MSCSCPGLEPPAKECFLVSREQGSPHRHPGCGLPGSGPPGIPRESVVPCPRAAGSRAGLLQAAVTHPAVTKGHCWPWAMAQGCDQRAVLAQEALGALARGVPRAPLAEGTLVHRVSRGKCLVQVKRPGWGHLAPEHPHLCPCAPPPTCAPVPAPPHPWTTPTRSHAQYSCQGVCGQGHGATWPHQTLQILHRTAQDPSRRNISCPAHVSPAHTRAGIPPCHHPKSALPLALAPLPSAPAQDSFLSCRGNPPLFRDRSPHPTPLCPAQRHPPYTGTPHPNPLPRDPFSPSPSPHRTPIPPLTPTGDPFYLAQGPSPHLPTQGPLSPCPPTQGPPSHPLPHTQTPHLTLPKMGLTTHQEDLEAEGLQDPTMAHCTDEDQRSWAGGGAQEQRVGSPPSAQSQQRPRGHRAPPFPCDVGAALPRLQGLLLAQLSLPSQLQSCPGPCALLRPLKPSQEVTQRRPRKAAGHTEDTGRWAVPWAGSLSPGQRSLVRLNACLSWSPGPQAVRLGGPWHCLPWVNMATARHAATGLDFRTPIVSAHQYHQCHRASCQDGDVGKDLGATSGSPLLRRREEIPARWQQWPWRPCGPSNPRTVPR